MTTADRIDIDRLNAAQPFAEALGCPVVVRNACRDCPAIATVPPPPGRVKFEHAIWCPVLAASQSRRLTLVQRSRPPVGRPRASTLDRRGQKR